MAESGSVRAGGTPKYPFLFVEVFSVAGTTADVCLNKLLDEEDEECSEA